MKSDAKSTIEAGKAILGIEFGSTRIKAVLIDQENKPIAQGSHSWENQLVDGLWTYSVEAICQFTPFNDAGVPSFNVRQAFLLDKDEVIYGLGQQQTGK